jgi:hypothetical protein
MHHIFNCHGEWLLVFQALATLPIVGAWVKSWITRHNHKHDE